MITKVAVILFVEIFYGNFIYLLAWIVSDTLQLIEI